MADQHEEVDFRNKPREAYTKYIDFYKLLGAGILVLVGVVIGRSLNPSQTESFDVNLTTEIISIAVTVFILGWYNDYQATKRFKRQLIDDAASTSNEIAKHAVHVMRRREWLQGERGILRNANLLRANLSDAFLRATNLENAHLYAAELQGADLVGANLRHAELVYADLRSADLTGADLRSASLGVTNLQDASLRDAQLQNANLNRADLKGARLIGAKLHGANLTDANLEAAYMSIAEYDHKTCLPDGRFWTKDTQMDRFTDSSHPEFWRSSIAGTPAYRWPSKHRSIP